MKIPNASTTLIATFAGMTFFFAALLLGGCEPDDNRAIGVSVDRIVGDPAAFYNSRVTVSGEVNDIFHARAFTIGGDDFENELLVLSIDSIGAVTGRSKAEPVRKHDVVQVSGVLRRYSADEITNELGLELDDVDEEFDGRPVVIARAGSSQLPTIVVTPRGGTATLPTEDELVTDFATAAGSEGRTLSRRMARFSGLRIAGTVDERSIWTRSDNSDSMFVVLTRGAVHERADDAPLDTSVTWDVYGILRDVPPPQELIDSWGLDEETARHLTTESVYLQAIHVRRHEPM